MSLKNRIEHTRVAVVVCEVCTGMTLATGRSLVERWSSCQWSRLSLVADPSLFVVLLGFGQTIISHTGHIELIASSVNK